MSRARVDWTSTGRDRGTCTGCGVDYEVTVTGKIRRHRLKATGELCEGGGERPKKED